MKNSGILVVLARFSHQISFSQVKTQAAQQVSDDSGSKLPRAACNVDPAEKSSTRKGELFDLPQKTLCFLLATCMVRKIIQLYCI